MEIYLDNAATTRVSVLAADAMLRALRTDYGNPSSPHHKGVTAETTLRQARETIADALKVSPREILFTSGGTEANNMAVLGAALANQRAGRHLVTTQIEHPSVANAFAQLADRGFSVTRLPVDGSGCLDMDALAAAIRPDTILVSVMCVNNEIGTIQPIDEIGKLVHRMNPQTLFHVDAVQGFTKLTLRPRNLGIDLLSGSAHKIHGPKGCGFLYVRERVKLRPLLFGGGQQRDLRPGTENVPGIAGFCAAVQESLVNRTDKNDRLYALRSDFVGKVLQMEDVQMNGCMQRTGKFSGAAPHIVSLSFGGIRAEVLLHALEERGIYVSAGSACASHHPGISDTLRAIGLSKRYLDATLRFSFSDETTQEEIDTCVQALNELVPALRRFTPGGRQR